MRVLVACEESQEVCKAFRAKGHEAYSCDIIDCSGGHPEWHIKHDVLDLLDGYVAFQTEDGVLHMMDSKWDMIIAHPPCTDLCVSGAAWFKQKRADGRQRDSIEFFCQFLNADCDKIVVENPVGIISGDYVQQWFPDLAEKYGLPKKPTQIISPWMFGDNHEKHTCLWIKGVNPLVPEVTEKPELEYFEWTDSKTGKVKRQPKWYAEAFKLSPAERAKVRSKTFPGIARSMAEQWS